MQVKIFKYSNMQEGRKNHFAPRHQVARPKGFLKGKLGKAKFPL